MRMKRLLFLMLSLLAIGWGARAQEQELTVYEGQGTNRYVPAFIFYFDDFTRSQFVIPATDLASMAGNTITAMKFYTTASNVPYTTVSVADVYLMEVDYTSISAFEPKSAATIVYQGTLNIVASGSGGELTITFDTPFFYQGGNLLIGIENTTDSGYKSIDFLGQNVTGASVAGYNASSLDGVTATQRNFIPQTTFYYTLGGEAPTCTKPKGLKLDETTTTTATVSWTAEEGSAYNLQYKAADSEEWTLVEGATSPYALTGLTPATTYEVQVQTACSTTEVSAWSSTLTFTTLETCVTPTNWDASQITMTARSVTLGWIVGDENQDTWEISYSTTAGFNPDEGTIVTVSSNPATIENLTPETRYYFTVRASCGGGDYSQWMPIINRTTPPTCIAPTAWANPVIQLPTSLSFGWMPGAEEQDSWQVAYWKEGDADPYSFDVDDPNVFTVMTDQPYVTINDLQPGTIYYLAVRAYCGGDDYSAWYGPGSLSTLEAYPAPTNVAAENVGGTNADITWSGRGDETSWNLRYRPLPEGNKLWDFESGLGDWTAVINGEGTGWSTTDLTASFGGQYTAHSGTHVAITRSWAGSSYQADNWLISPELDLGGTLSYWVMDDGGYHEYYTVMISTKGNEPENFTLLYEPAAPPTSTWQQVTIDLSAYAGQKGYIAFHHNDYDQDFLLIDDIMIDSGNGTPWTEVTGVTSPYTIEGLTPETTYEVEVQAAFDPFTPADNPISTWTGTTFTTLSAMTPPSNVTADNVTSTTADIDWRVNGTETKWNLRYAESITVFEEGAEGATAPGLPDGWTSVDADGDGNGWKTANTGYAPYAGSLIFYSESYDNDSGPLTPENLLISPQVELGGVFSFYAKGQDPTYYAEHFAIFVSTRGTDAADFVKVSDEFVTTSSYQLYSVDLSAYAGQQGYIAIKHYNVTDMYQLVVDNIKYAAIGEWTEVNGVTEHPVALEGLTPGTDYNVQVQAVYDDGSTSEWVSGQFTTTTDLIVLDNDYDQPEGQKNTDLLAANMGKTVNFTISGRTLYKDGSWNTIILPFSMTKEQFDASPLAGADIQFVSTTSTVEGTHVTLEFGDFAPYLEGGYSFFAGYPFFVKWESGENIVDPTFTGVVIKESEDPFSQLNNDATIFSIGQYSSLMMYPPEELTGDDDALIYYLGSDNKLRYTGKQRLLNAFRHAFVFRATDGSALPAGELDFTLNFDDGTTTGIVEVDGTTARMPEGYYNIQGMKLNNAPKQKGIYITNGKKFIVK